MAGSTITAPPNISDRYSYRQKATLRVRDREVEKKGNVYV
jgi:hypothetical protein